MGMDLGQDYIEHLFVASTHDYLLSSPRSAGLPAEITEPRWARQSKGRAIVNLLPFAQGEGSRP
jgi:hypothetical protein